MNIEFLKSLLLDPLKGRTPAQATLASWIAKCNTGSGGDNLLKHEGRLYVIDPTIHVRERKDGSLEGHIWFHDQTGLHPLGRYYIAADGRVEQMPEELRGVLTQAFPEPAPTITPTEDDDAATRDL